MRLNQAKYLDFSMVLDHFTLVLRITCAANTASISDDGLKQFHPARESRNELVHTVAGFFQLTSAG